VQDTIEQAVRDVAAGVVRASRTAIEVEYTRYYPATINHPEQAQLALDAARSAGLEAQTAATPAFTAEDFAFMLQQRPGAYLWLGQRGAVHSAALHHPSYDFNDDVLAFGVRWFVAVARLALNTTNSLPKQ
jgi:hippurate hydrolase